MNPGFVSPAKEIMVDGWGPYESAPKTCGSAGTIALDSVKVALLREHHKAMPSAREEWGAAWNETGKFFSRKDGS